MEVTWWSTATALHPGGVTSREEVASVEATRGLCAVLCSPLPFLLYLPFPSLPFPLLCADVGSPSVLPSRLGVEVDGVHSAAVRR